jgi:hypothetical protein
MNNLLVLHHNYLPEVQAIEFLALPLFSSLCLSWWSLSSLLTVVDEAIVDPFSGLGVQIKEDKSADTEYQDGWYVGNIESIVLNIEEVDTELDCRLIWGFAWILICRSDWQIELVEVISCLRRLQLNSLAFGGGESCKVNEDRWSQSNSGNEELSVAHEADWKLIDSLGIKVGLRMKGKAFYVWCNLLHLENLGIHPSVVRNDT